jgi:hypothetical protein
MNQMCGVRVGPPARTGPSLVLEKHNAGIAV